MTAIDNIVGDSINIEDQISGRKHTKAINQYVKDWQHVSFSSINEPDYQLVVLTLKLSCLSFTRESTYMQPDYHIYGVVEAYHTNTKMSLVADIIICKRKIKMSMVV